MGRPLTDRWIGTPQGNDPVLMPVINNGGRLSCGWIIKQVGSDRFLVQDCDTDHVGSYRLCESAEPPMPGLMSIRFTGIATGFAMRITNTKIKDWHGNHHEWSIWGPEPNRVHVVDSSLAGELPQSKLSRASA